VAARHLSRSRKGRELFPELTVPREPQDGRVHSHGTGGRSSAASSGSRRHFPILAEAAAASWRGPSAGGGEQQMLAIGAARLIGGAPG